MGNGILVLRNFNGDTTRVAAAFTSNNLNVNGLASLNNNLIVNNNLNLTGNARLTANNSNILLAGTTSSIDNTSNNYIVTNGTGKLQIDNIGAGARTGNVVFPIGSATNYNPATLSNSGSADIFGARTEPGIRTGYTGETPAGSSYTTGALNNTWFITEAAPGGSNATITLQWNAAQELPFFNRTQSRFGHYTNGSWQLGTAAPASGSDPYTYTGTGVTSFSPFSIFNSTAVVPVSFAILAVKKTSAGNELTWNIQSADQQQMIIERSFTGSVFTALHSRNFIAAGNYPDADNNRSAKIYYRIKLIDNNGRISYSNTVMVLNNNDTVSIYPTIFTSQLTIQNNAVGAKMFMLYQADGKLILNRSIRNGTNIISMSNISSGIYLYKIFDEYNIQHGQLIKQ